jgi:hypothetical protein
MIKVAPVLNKALRHDEAGDEWRYTFRYSSALEEGE